MAAPSVRRDDPGALERLRPCHASGHVVFEQTTIEAKGSAECEQRRIGIAVEAAGPQVRHRQRPAERRLTVRRVLTRSRALGDWQLTTRQPPLNRCTVTVPVTRG